MSLAGGSPAQRLEGLCDFLAPAQAPDELGRLGPYRVLKVLGAGGMGVVFQAEDPQLQRPVALKALLPGRAGSESARQRFLREARAAAALKHDHIVTIHQVGEDRGIHFLAMEFLEGEPLDARLEREGKLPLPEVLRIGREIAEGLAAAHERGLTHRDIKPANIWLETRSECGMRNAERNDPPVSDPSAFRIPHSAFKRVKILDFGLARVATDGPQLTQEGVIVGTPAYMAPEQAQGKAVDPRCDLFSLGCVLYRMTTGDAPFHGTDVISTLMAVATEQPRPPHQVDPSLPPALSKLIMALLAKEPGYRPASAQVVAETLERIAREQEARTTARPGTAVRPAGVVRACTALLLPVVDRVRRSMPSLHRPAGFKGPGFKRPQGWRVAAAGGLGAALIAGILIFWPTPRGAVRIESEDPTVEVVFDKAGPTIRGAGKEPIVLRAGEHGILVRRGDFAFETDRFVVKKGQTVALKVKVLAGKVQVTADGRGIGAGALPADRPGNGFTNSLGMEFVLVPRGRSWLGGSGGRFGETEVECAADFYLGKYEVTQEEWQKVTGSNPSHFARTGAGKDAVKDIPDADLNRFPVEQVSWNEAQMFLKMLNSQANETGWEYRLPTEREWEYACRGGPLTDRFESAFDFYFDAPASQLQPDEANFEHGKGLKRTCKVGNYRPNRLGLYDMHGNVWEWCADGPKDTNGPPRRAIRSASWTDPFERCRAAFASAEPPSARGLNNGLRLARVPAGKAALVAPVPAKAPPSEPPYTNNLGMEFVRIPKGKSWLGGIGGLFGDEEVEVKEEFYLGVYAVTQEEWQKVMGSNPSSFSRTGPGKEAVKDVADADLKRFPVETVSWADVQEFLKRLNAQVKEPGWAYRLPKGVEWEYACRGGPMADRFDSAFNYYFEKPRHQLRPDDANFDASRKGRTCKVGSYPPNRLGLYDMHGNVWEWCDDVTQDDPSRREHRGGSWRAGLPGCGARYRGGHPSLDRRDDRGLRLARVPVGKEILVFLPEGGQPPRPADPPYRNRLGMEFVRVPKGKAWLRGGGGRIGDQEVQFTEDFYLGKYEVTQEEWEKVTGSNPSHFSRNSTGWSGFTGNGRDYVKNVPDAVLKRFPVENVSWNDVQMFLKLLNIQAKETGWVYRLPRETEWEYACRGGPMADRFDSAFDYYLDRPANYLRANQDNFGKHGSSWSQRVGSYLPNRLGLHDMHGNVREWCDDALSDPNNPQATPVRVFRGGCAYHVNGEASHREAWPPTGRHYELGFRVARVRADGQAVAPRPAAVPKPEPSGQVFTNGIGMEFVRVPRGKSWLGGGGGKPGDKEVEVPYDFYLGRYETTQAEWEKVAGSNPSAFRVVAGVSREDLKRFPVEQVSWNDAQLFLKVLNAQEKTTGWVYRLPTVIEWEYACRGGPMTDRAESAFDFYLDKPSNELRPDQANFGKGGAGRSCPVGSYRPNRLGLHDMHGNVREWCDDRVPDPNNALGGLLHHYRGGCWFHGAGSCQAGPREGLWVRPPGYVCHDLGLRVALVPVGKGAVKVTP